MHGLRFLHVTACAVAMAAGGALVLERAAVAQPASDLLARGQYLTGDAGQCSDCHGAGFVGGPNPVPGPPGVPWAPNVPALRGLTMFANDADAIAFLHTAKLPGGQGARGPMPRYMFSVADATAIVAYLRSLK